MAGIELLLAQEVTREAVSTRLSGESYPPSEMARRIRLSVFGAILFVLGVCGVAGARGVPSIVPVAQGRLLALPAKVEIALRHDHRNPHVYLIATRGGRNFYRIGDSGRCYGAAPAANLDHLVRFRDPAAALGGYECAGKTTVRLTVVDRSTWGKTPSDPAMHLRGLVGIASNSVRSIQLLAPNGTVLATVPVKNNIYLASRVPPDVSGLRAVSARGVVLWQKY
jgi:hypothetical protein